jgi:hypothetical protein
MNLPRGDQAVEIEIQRLEQAAAVLGHGLRTVGGRSPEVERRVGGGTDPARTGREREARPRRLVVESPGGHGRTNIE